RMLCSCTMTFFFCCALSHPCPTLVPLFFFFNDTATTEIYTLSLHDALPILKGRDFDDHDTTASAQVAVINRTMAERFFGGENPRSEEHTSELQSLTNLVCRLLLEKKKNRRQRSRAMLSLCLV